MDGASDPIGEGTGVVILGGLVTIGPERVRRELERRGAVLRRRVSGRTGVVVIGRRAVRLLGTQRWDALLAGARAGRARVLGEGAFLRALGLAGEIPEAGGRLSAEEVRRAGRLDRRTLEALVLFDVLVPVDGSFAFADALLARDVGRMLHEGVALASVVGPLARLRSALRTGPSAARLVMDAGDGLLLRIGGRAATLAGQFILDLPGSRPRNRHAAELLEEGEEAEYAGDPAAAERCYRAAAAASPRDPAPQFSLANLLVRLGRGAEARARYDRAGRLDPGFAEAWYNRALCLLDAGRDVEAERDLSRALCGDPAFADALFRLAMLLLGQGRRERACILFERYLRLQPHEPWRGVARRAIQLCRMERLREAGAP
ncbi:tetratricopeptide repeat protein [Arenibaculum sp.]|uniref:tetratricopeptide repeat protein n=1 Tax=Arenibaculum sp. TaxID=2865862 RepID=UPI002E0D2643|nr:tetratricopeptide repeat protein [Arenibaculum sp.]